MYFPKFSYKQNQIQMSWLQTKHKEEGENIPSEDYIGKSFQDLNLGKDLTGHKKH